MIEVDDFVSKFTDEKLNGVLKIRRNYFQVSDELLEVKERINGEPFSIGKFLGTGKPFHPSTSLIDWLGKRADNYVIVDRKSAWLFMCGRDIFLNSIIKRTVKKGPVIVKNEAGEILGYGDLVRRKIAVRNMLDKGDFIRREKR